MKAAQGQQHCLGPEALRNFPNRKATLRGHFAPTVPDSPQQAPLDIPEPLELTVGARVSNPLE